SPVHATGQGLARWPPALLSPGAPAHKRPSPHQGLLEKVRSPCCAEYAPATHGMDVLRESDESKGQALDRRQRGPLRAAKDPVGRLRSWCRNEPDVTRHRRCALRGTALRTDGSLFHRARSLLQISPKPPRYAPFGSTFAPASVQALYDPARPEARRSPE